MSIWLLVRGASDCTRKQQVHKMLRADFPRLLTGPWISTGSPDGIMAAAERDNQTQSTVCYEDSMTSPKDAARGVGFVLSRRRRQRV